MPANQQPLAYLVLQADSFRMYQFILSILSTMLSTYLLLALILSVAITVHEPADGASAARDGQELENISQDEAPYHQLMLPALHRTTSSACWCATTTAINRRWPRRMPT